jgi:hypothetical protein
MISPTIVAGFLACFMNQDADKFVSYFSDDAVFELADMGVTFKGKAEIRAFIQERILAGNATRILDPTGVRVVGDTAYYSATLKNAKFNALGLVNGVHFTMELTGDAQGKVVYGRRTMDPMDLAIIKAHQQST